MRMAGPREAVWHAIIRKNFGCSHLIVGRDHAGPGRNSAGEPFYGKYEAQRVVGERAEELGITVVPFPALVYVQDLDRYVPEDDVPSGSTALRVSGTEVRRRIAEGREIPAWLTFPDVVACLRANHPPRARQGFTVFFTGLSGSGKSTIANILMVKLLERGGRRVTLLDGDVVRKHLSSELGFSKEDRDTNIRRIGFVAAEITKNGGVAICAPIAPYDAVRHEVRHLIEGLGGFVLVYVNTPLEVCEKRDRKGLYAKARAGIVRDFTGISDPYEPPADADIVLDTTMMMVEEAADRVFSHLETDGYLGTP
jgi:sulfate adenylyltransferase